jgi:rare lipoprotein A
MRNPTEHIKSNVIRLTASLALVAFASCGNATHSKPEEVIPGYKVKTVETGKASWYNVRTNRGYSTASGERLDERGATAAHKTLPMGTKVRVTNLVNGNSEVVRINDRGPFIKGRIIDVTIGTAEKLGFVRSGVVPVKVEVLKKIDDE